MHFSRPIFRLLAGTLGFFLVLTPATALALPRDLGQLVPAATATSPLLHETDPSASYRAAVQRLAALGINQGMTDTLWNRLGPSLSAQLDSGALTAQQLNYCILPHFRQERIARYVAYAHTYPELTAEEVVSQVNMDLDRDFFEDVIEILDPTDPLVLVNKHRVLPQFYIPELVALDPAYGLGSLTSEAADAFVQMADAARADGIFLHSVSAYRSYTTQTNIYRRYVSQFGQAQADAFSARPGYSEHQTGLALDINIAQSSALFEATEEFAWLQAHCAQFGFLLRYPKDKESITGYSFEPWHYRYVGTEIAGVCTDQELTLEEYISRQSVPGLYQVPDLYYEENPLNLGHGALLLDDIPYLSPVKLAAALDWQMEETENSLVLSDGQHHLSFTVGRRCVRDGMLMRLSSPAVKLGGELYLSLPDLCAAFNLELTATAQGLELTPISQPSLTLVRG